jgi:predicted ferric reductase
VRLPRRVLAALLVAPVIAGAAAVVGLWWHDTPPTCIHTLSDALIAAGRVTGLLGAYALLLQVALMARIPWLERHIGSDWLARAHRWLGSYLVALLVAHAALLIGGLALIDHVSVLDESVTVALSYPNVLMATVGLALLIAVGAMSARAVRRRVRYEVWHFTHLYAYLAGALAFTHQIAVGADFTNPIARVGWTAAHLLVAACVIRFRLWRPLALAVRHRLRVYEVALESDRVVSIYVTGRRLDRLGAEAGQFFRWRFLGRGMWWQAHPFSLSAAPAPNMLRLTVKVVGDHTRSLQRLRSGVRVVAEGPYGAVTGLQRTRRRVILIAGGIGITPMRALLEGLPAGPGDITLVFRGDQHGARVFAEELEGLAARRGALVHYVLGPRAKCCPRHDPLSERRLRELVPDVANRDAYLCGPPGMMASAQRALRLAGVPRRRIHAERFDM